MTMYCLYAGSTCALLDMTNDLALAHEWAERSSRYGYLIHIRWHSKVIASYENGARIDMTATERIAA